MTIHPVPAAGWTGTPALYCRYHCEGESKNEWDDIWCSDPGFVERDAILGVSTSTKPNAARALRTMQDRARNKLMH